MTQEEQKQFNLLSGKLASAAKDVINSQIGTLSDNIIKLSSILYSYDEFVIKLTIKEE